MDPLTILGVGGLGLGLWNTVFSNIWNAKNNQIAQKNFNLQSENLDYQKSLQEQIFNREDTALQRRMEDAKNAGLNPYSVLNLGGASSGNVVKTEAPQQQMLQNVMQLNGVLDFLNSGMDVMSRIQQTKNERADYDIKDLQRRILNIQLDDYALGNFNHMLDTKRNIKNYNYDFGTNISNLGKYGASDIYGYSELPGLGYNYDYIGDAFSWNKFVDRNNKSRQMDILDLEYAFANKDWENYDSIIKARNADAISASARAELLQKQNDSYYFDKGVDLVSGLLDNVWRGISAFTGLGSLNVARNNSYINRMNANTNWYRAYNQYNGFYW